MEMPHFFPLGGGLELTQTERQEDQLVLHVKATSVLATWDVRSKKASCSFAQLRPIPEQES